MLPGKLLVDVKDHTDTSDASTLLDYTVFTPRQLFPLLFSFSTAQPL
jgi:hypothetical protein